MPGSACVHLRRPSAVTGQLGRRFWHHSTAHRMIFIKACSLLPNNTEEEAATCDIAQSSVLLGVLKRLQQNLACLTIEIQASTMLLTFQSGIIMPIARRGRILIKSCRPFWSSNSSANSPEGLVAVFANKASPLSRTTSAPSILMSGFLEFRTCPMSQARLRAGSDSTRRSITNGSALWRDCRLEGIEPRTVADAG
jgi:hypothetical protein